MGVGGKNCDKVCIRLAFKATGKMNFRWRGVAYLHSTISKLNCLILYYGNTAWVSTGTGEFHTLKAAEVLPYLDQFMKILPNSNSKLPLLTPLTFKNEIKKVLAGVARPFKK